MDLIFSILIQNEQLMQTFISCGAKLQIFGPQWDRVFVPL